MKRLNTLRESELRRRSSAACLEAPPGPIDEEKKKRVPEALRERRPAGACSEGGGSSDGEEAAMVAWRTEKMDTCLPNHRRRDGGSRRIAVRSNNAVRTSGCKSALAGRSWRSP